MVKFFLFLLSCIQIASIRYFPLDIIRKSKYLPEKGRCLAVSANDKILRLRCNRNHPSMRWLWTNSGHMMNLRTLRCLQAKTQRGRKTLILKQCDNNNLDQRWTCYRSSTIQNQGQKGFRKRWIRKRKKKSRSSSYFRDCNSDRSSYKGSYRFSDGQFIQLVNRSGNCNTAEEQNCSLAFNVRAPIFIQHTYCSFDWINSKYSHDDARWHYIQEDREEFSVHTKSPNETVLTIRNKILLLKKWSGTLLRLEIVCKSNFSNSSENHHVLLKIANDKSAKIISSSVVPSSTSASTTLSTSTSKSSLTGSCPRPTTRSNEDNDGSKAIIIIIVCIILVGVAFAGATGLMFYKRGKRSCQPKESQRPITDQRQNTALHSVEGPLQSSNPLYSERIGSHRECELYQSSPHHPYQYIDTDHKPIPQPPQHVTYDYAINDGLPKFTGQCSNREIPAEDCTKGSNERSYNASNASDPGNDESKEKLNKQTLSHKRQIENCLEDKAKNSESLPKYHVLEEP